MEAHPCVVQLAGLLRPRGLDVVQPFHTAWYDDHVAPAHRLPRPSPGATLGVLIGSSAALWSPLLDALAADPALAASADPIDDYAEASVRDALAALTIPATTAWPRPGATPLISFTRLAAASGAAWISPAHLAIHPTLGPWWAMRAALVLDRPGPVGPPPHLPPPCHACPHACAPAFALALHTPPGPPPDLLRWLPPRDACPLGRDARYSEAQLMYHYTRDRRWLGPPSV